MVKRIIITIMCVFIFVIGLSGCSKQTWTFEEDDEYTDLIVSPKGEKYYLWGRNYYISGLKKDKLLGKFDFDGEEEDEFESEEEKKEYLNYIDNIRRVYSVSAPNDSVVVQYNGISTREKYFFTLDGGSNCYISFRIGEGYDFNYKDTNVSSVAFIPYDEIPYEGLYDYEKYVSKHGIFGDDAKAVISQILFDKSEEEIFSQEGVSEAQRIGHGSERLGRIVYYPEDADWFCYDAEAIYSTDGGFYLRVYRITTYDVYPISCDVAEMLGIDISIIED